MLKDILGELVRAEAFLTGADASRVTVNADDRAADDGADASTPPATAPSAWLKDYPICWQMKAGNAGTASRIRGEVLKPSPAKTLREGGGFVLLAPGSVNGPKGITERLNTLVTEAKRHRIPTSRIQVLDAHQLATWINTHPAIAGRLRGLPEGVVQITDLLSSPHHRDTWFPSESHKQLIGRARGALDLTATGPLHVHLHGRPGVGKTRLALEICRDAPWRGLALYVPDAARADVDRVLGALATAPDAHAVLVVDEAETKRVKHLNQAVAMTGGRARLLTIGNHRSPDAANILGFEVEPFSEQQVFEAVGFWHPMPIEHRRFVAKFADGYMRLARLAANAIVAMPAPNIDALLQQHDIRLLLDQMLGHETDRHPLHVLALAETVGWSGDREDEGHAIAVHLGMNWTTVQAKVQAFHDRYAIAPLAGDLRYLTPLPLALLLAREAIQSYPSRVKSLLAALPNESIRTAHNARLRTMSGSPQVADVAREEIGRPFDWTELRQWSLVERFAALAPAAPSLAARQIHRALSDTTLDERREIDHLARRRLVDLLVELMSSRDAFSDAAEALGLLATAENESWANNATSEFLARFSVHAPTASPYADRLGVLDRLIASADVQGQALGIRALAMVQPELLAGRAHVDFAAGVRPTEWRPNQEEFDRAFAAACERLAAAAALPGDTIEAALVFAASKLAMALRQRERREDVARFLRAIKAHHPHLREQLRIEIADVLDRETRYWKELPIDDVDWLESVRAEFSDLSIGGRIREAVTGRWIHLDPQIPISLANELVASPDALRENGAWLASGEATAAWDLGRALGRVDTSGSLLDALVELRRAGRDLRILCGYLVGHAPSKEWIVEWLERFDEADADNRHMVFEVIWRCADTEKGLSRLAAMFRRGVFGLEQASHLAYGQWIHGATTGAFSDLFAAIHDAGVSLGVLAHVLHHRLTKHPSDLAPLRAAVREVVISTDLLHDHTMDEYTWTQLAVLIANDEPAAVAATMFRAHGRPSDGHRHWWIQHGSALGVLRRLAENAPTAVWNELAPFLAEENAHSFVIGFPRDVLPLLPADAIIQWVAETPEKRLPVLAAVLDEPLEEGTLAYRLLDRFGGIERVQRAFLSAYMSGPWVGPGSDHWQGKRDALLAAATQVPSVIVRQWALRSAEHFGEMAEHDRKREAEESVRWR